MTVEKPYLVLVENDPHTWPLYYRELSPHYSVITCETETHAVAVLEEEEIALIILEPANGNGWAWNFVDKLKQDEQTKTIPVIFCTVLDERRKGMAIGAAAYLLKPVYAHVLRQCVQDLLIEQEVPQAE